MWDTARHDRVRHYSHHEARQEPYGRAPPPAIPQPWGIVQSPHRLRGQTLPQGARPGYRAGRIARGWSMSSRTSLSSTDMLSVMRHLADVVALKGDPPAQRQLLIDGLSRIVGTHQAFFFVGDQWRRDKRPHFVHQTLSQDRDPVFLKYMAEFGVRYPLTADPFCARSIGDARPVQLWTFPDVLPNSASEKRHEPFVEIRRAGRVTDGVVSICRHPGKDDRVIGVGMHQFGAARPLRPRQRALVLLAMGEIRRLVARGHLVLPPVE